MGVVNHPLPVSFQGPGLAAVWLSRCVAGVYGLNVLFWCVDCAFIILETHGLCASRSRLGRCLWVSHPVGVLRQYVSEPGSGFIHHVVGGLVGAGVLFEICIVCVSVFVSTWPT